MADLHHLQVAARAEARIATGQHHAANIAVDDESLERATQLPHQRRRKDIEPVGFVEGHHRPVAAVLDVHPTRRIGVVAVGDQPVVQRFCCAHQSSSSIALARNVFHAASANVLTTPRGIRGSSPAIQYRLNSCAGPNHNAAVTPGLHRAQGSVAVVRPPPVPHGGEERPVGFVQLRAVEPVAQQQRRLAAVGGHPPQMMCDAAADPALRGVVTAQHRHESRLVLAHHLGVDRGRQRGFVREVVVQRADADLGVPSDLIERRGEAPSAANRRRADCISRPRASPADRGTRITLAQQRNPRSSGERALPGDVPADDEGLDFRSSFVGDQGLHVAQVAHDMEVEQDTVAA